MRGGGALAVQLCNRRYACAGEILLRLAIPSALQPHYPTCSALQLQYPNPLNLLAQSTSVFGMPLGIGHTRPSSASCSAAPPPPTFKLPKAP